MKNQPFSPFFSKKQKLGKQTLKKAAEANLHKRRFTARTHPGDLLSLQGIYHLAHALPCLQRRLHAQGEFTADAHACHLPLRHRNTNGRPRDPK